MPSTRLASLLDLMRLAAGRSSASSSRRLAFLVAIVSIFFLCVGPVVLSGCGGAGDDSSEGGKKKKKKKKRSSSSGDDDDEEGEGSVLENLERRAKNYIKEAKAAKADVYFARLFEKAEGRIEEAEDAVMDGKVDKAEMKYKLAISGLKTMLRDAGKVARVIEDARELEKEALEAKAKADKVKAEENAPDDYSDALAYLKKARSSLKKNTDKDAKSAANSFRKASDAFGEAAIIAKDNAVDRRLAEQEMVAMAANKKLGIEKKANSSAFDVWQIGESNERSAKADMERGEFRHAAQGFKDASSQYISAMKSVLDKADFDKMIAKQEAAQEKWLEERRKQEALADARRQTTSGLPGSGNRSGGPSTPDDGQIDFRPTATCFSDDPDFDPDNYPNELDEEDEAFLQENIGKLTKLGESSYDPVTGQIQLDYGIGRLVKKETNVLKTPRKHLQWEDPMMRGTKTEDLTEEITFGVGGNTKGMILFPVPFRYRVHISYQMNIMTMTGAGSFGFIWNFDPKKKSFWRNDFLNIGRIKGLPKWVRAKGDKGSRNANYWADKTRVVPWEIEYKMPNPSKVDKGPTKSGHIRVVYDVGGDDEFINASGVPASMDRGYVGLIWNQVKFRCRSVKICGMIDKQMAVARLREITGIKKGSQKEDEPEEEPEEENPTAPAGEDTEGGEASKPKKTDPVKPVDDY